MLSTRLSSDAGKIGPLVAGLRELLQEIYLGLTIQHDGRVFNQHCIIFESSRVRVLEEGNAN
jgi:hypothetical protein